MQLRYRKKTRWQSYFNVNQKQYTPEIYEKVRKTPSDEVGRGMKAQVAISHLFFGFFLHFSTKYMLLLLLDFLIFTLFFVTRKSDFFVENNYIFS